MGKTNYSKMSTQKIREQDRLAEKEKVDVVEPAVSDDICEEPEVVEAVKVVYGKPSKCQKLNVREKPDPMARVLEVIDQNARVEIDEGASTKMWYKVTTPAGTVGYCMKEFMTIV